MSASPFYNKPGSALKALLERHGIQSNSSGCHCSDIAAQMDTWGSQNCLAHMDNVVNQVHSSMDLWKKELGIKEYLFLVPSVIGVWREIGFSGIPESMDELIEAAVTYAINQSL